MTSYFEKLTSINTASLNRPNKTDLNSALDKIDELKKLNSKLELDLKCEHDEKSDLVSLKVGLENEVLELREVNERLEFQVTQLRVEKDKIHNALAKFKEDMNTNGGMFIAGSSTMKKFPSLDDLTVSPCVSPTLMSRITTTPTTLERITEEDESVLESLVLSGKHVPSDASHSLQEMKSKIALLEAENAMLKLSHACPKCRSDDHPSTSSSSHNLMIFEDEGLVLSAVDEQYDKQDNVEKQVADILNMQRKVNESVFEYYLFLVLHSDSLIEYSRRFNKDHRETGTGVSI
ncbi:unnamed protein product [Orchesella dallaii]|uniref:Uncharacterized protein n=1 Tax=Orchesella dallaii TaxID=48710 RepID=A0ABP1Q620_9HEXA